MSFLVAIFWTMLACIVYTYLLFPAILAIRARFWKRPIHSGPVVLSKGEVLSRKLVPSSPTHHSGDHRPVVSLVIAAHNEQASIEKKIDNVRKLGYPKDKLQVLLASDGSNDRTVEVARSMVCENLEILDLPRTGKASALNSAVQVARGDILVFSDANSMYAPDAIDRLVAPFSDERVGGVAGDQRYQKSTDDGDGERAYWSLDRALKRWESAAGNVISATGAIYAIRKKLFMAVPDGVTDDFVTSTRIILQGYRLVFAEDAIAYEPATAKSELEFHRKVRIMTRGFRGVWMVRPLLNPLRFGFYSLQLFSHKVLRRLMVIPLIVLFLTSAALAPWNWFYAVAFAGQAWFYLLALIGMVVRKRPVGRIRLLKLPVYFCLMNTAALLALIHTLRGHRIDRWEPLRAIDSAIV